MQPHYTRWVTLITITCVFVLASLWAIKWLITSREHQLFGPLVHRVNTQEKVVALTFDDGPNPIRTQKILAILERENIKATFFLNGHALSTNKTEAKLLIASKHEIGNHSYSHKRMVLMSPATVAREVESTERILGELGYTHAKRRLFFRPPYGNKFLVLPYYLQQQGITTVTWDIEPETTSHSQMGPDYLSNHVVQNVRPGSIVLLHVMSGSSDSLNAVTPIIRHLHAKGYQFLTVSELLEKQNRE